jgi:hypothetical protein
VADDIAGRKEKGPDVGPNPVRSKLRSPSVDEKTDGTQDCADEHQRDTELGLSNVVISALQETIDFVIDGCSDLRSKPEANTCHLAAIQIRIANLPKEI